ncbi:MAG TPA: hypothetical protein VL371_09170 [Gemmataceae bacterium]|jgi:hypothetical protein|nr:hypothetical protein [Gemmataceae bacterium]
MTAKKSLREREKELKSLLATPAGRDELKHLESCYAAKGARLRVGRTSIITYLLVYERELGLISNA